VSNYQGVLHPHTPGRYGPVPRKEVPKQMVRESCSKGEVGGNSFLTTEDKIPKYWASPLYTVGYANTFISIRQAAHGSPLLLATKV
jgi:hypothetical protein